MKNNTIAVLVTAGLSASVFAPISIASASDNSASLLEQQDSLEVITVTANRYQSPLSQSLANQTVIDASDIAALNATSLGEVLTTVAGFDLSQTGGRGQAASLFLRGNNASHTLFLLNGVKLTSATLGLAEFQKLSVSNIERIEIVKGPRAAVWGSEAIGGVVNVITTSDVESTVLNAELGSFNRKQVSLSTGIEHGDGHSSILIDHEQSDGFDVLGDSQNEEDGYRYNSFAINGSQSLSDELSVNWLANFDRGHSEYDSLFGGADQAKHNNQQLAFGIDYRLKKNVITVDLSRLVDDASTYFVESSTHQVVEGSQIKTERNTVSATNLYTATKNLSLFAGFDLTKEQVSGLQSFTQNDRSITAAYAQSNYQSANWLFEGALRYDDVEDVDAELTYNLALGYNTTESGVTLNLGTGFKTPTFNDLYWPEDAFSKGNADLESERSRNIELSAYYHFEKVQLAASVFQNKVDNLIEWLPDASFIYQPQNVNSVTIKGLELGVQGQFGSLNHNLNLTLIDPKNDVTDETLTLRAKTRANYILNAQITDSVSSTVKVSHVGKREQKSWDGSVTTLKRYTQFDLNGHYQLDEDIAVSLGVKDAFDKQQPSAVGYQAAGRRVSLSTTVKF